jgi:hypothetical protein
MELISSDPQFIWRTLIGSHPNILCSIANTAALVVMIRKMIFAGARGSDVG